MGLGTLTRYKIGQTIHGVAIKNIFPENVLLERQTKRWMYLPTQYYVMYDCGRGVGPEPWFMLECQINAIAAKAEYKLRQTLDKKYESKRSKKPSKKPSKVYRLYSHLQSRYSQ
jgi:hypothetical protein